MIKGIQKDRTLVKIYPPNIRASKYVKQILMNVKGEMDSNIVIAGDFNTPFTSIDRTFRQKINKETVALNDTLDQMDLIDYLQSTYSKAAKYTFF